MISNPLAQYRLGDCFENGRGVEKNINDAVHWYRLSAEQRTAKAQYELGGCYSNGIGVQRSVEEAFKWYRMAAEQGHSVAQYILGDCYYRGRGVERNAEESIKWLIESAEQMESDALMLLAEYDVCWAPNEDPTTKDGLRFLIAMTSLKGWSSVFELVKKEWAKDDSTNK